MFTEDGELVNRNAVVKTGFRRISTPREVLIQCLLPLSTPKLHMSALYVLSVPSRSQRS